MKIWRGILTIYDNFEIIFFKIDFPFIWISVSHFKMIPLFYLVKEKSEYFKASIFIEDIENICKTNNNKTIVKNIQDIF